MKQTILFLIAACCGIFNLQAQEGCRIRVKLQGFQYDTLWFGHTYGKRCVQEFFGLKQPDGFYELKSEQPLQDGMYAIIYRQGVKGTLGYISCWLAKGERNFTLETSVMRTFAAAKISGSPENEALFGYLRTFDGLYDHLDSLNNNWKYKPTEETWQQRKEAEAILVTFQQDFIKQHPGSLTADFVSKTQYLIPPDMGKKKVDWLQESADYWRWQRQHFFGEADIAAEENFRYPQHLERLDYFLFHLPPPSPDTAKALLDDVFRRLESNPEARKYYLRYIIKSLNRMSQFQLDEVFVYMVHKYLEPDKSIFTEVSEADKMISEAQRMESLFVGKTAPDATLYDKNNQPVQLHKITAPLTLMIFWQPDCSHCKRELPLIKKIYERFQPKGLKVVTVCGKSGTDTPACWEYMDSQSVPADWYNLADPERKSGIASSYNVRSFPRLYILDADKRILFKRAGEMTEPELESILTRVIENK